MGGAAMDNPGSPSVEVTIRVFANGGTQVDHDSKNGGGNGNVGTPPALTPGLIEIARGLPPNQEVIGFASVDPSNTDVAHWVLKQGEPFPVTIDLNQTVALKKIEMDSKTAAELM